MLKEEFSHFEDLITCVKADKDISGATAGVANRFPVRFVLFDNFQDSYQFISFIQDSGCRFKSVNDWMDKEYPDTILTYSELSDNIIEYTKSFNDDCVITPFSELARFYNNEKSSKEFDALVKTIKGIENSPEAFSKNRRVYIPIVGLEGKMSLFEKDSQSILWYLKNNDKSLSYNLVLTNETAYGVQDLSQYNVAKNVDEWLNVWKSQPAVKPLIVCTSKAIFVNAKYAQPDNAFNFVICYNAYDFLVKGLNLKFGEIVYKESDKTHWERLASELTDVNPNTFSFDSFFNSYFHIDNLADYNVFLKTWFECNDEFEKWLLCTYYNEKFCQNGYICQSISRLQGYSNIDFFTSIALTIFTLDKHEDYIDERKVCMQAAVKHNIVLSQDVEYTLQDELNKLVATTDYANAIRYFSPLTKIEKTLALEWFANDYVSRDDLQSFFPDLYNYLDCSFESEQGWVKEYFEAYKKAKLHNKYLSSISEFIKKYNASSLTFNTWYQEIKTTKTILSGRSDIEVFYWIDGLGADWIPYIRNIIVGKQSENIYLNEIYLARALYPTTTANNKQALLDLSNNTLKKYGDLDSHAHQNTNEFPTYILEEFEIVSQAIDKILSEYNGKKIAIVSDHGLSALSQLCDGMNLAGMESDHHGRIAIRKNGNAVADNNYIICDDAKTMCALNHRSLCGKVPFGQSAHGGCSPEEIIVPIFVISSKKEASQWTAKLLTKEVSESSPIIKYSIKGLSSIDSPFIEYNGKKYILRHIGNGVYESDGLSLNGGVTSVILVIGDKKQSENIDVKLGAEEDDLLNF